MVIAYVAVTELKYDKVSVGGMHLGFDFLLLTFQVFTFFVMRYMMMLTIFIEAVSVN